MRFTIEWSCEIDKTHALAGLPAKHQARHARGGTSFSLPGPGTHQTIEVICGAGKRMNSHTCHLERTGLGYVDITKRSSEKAIRFVALPPIITVVPILVYKV